MAGSGTAQLRSRPDLLLRVSELSVRFRLGGAARVVHAVSDVAFDVARGETLGLVGESGCGKSTLGRAIAQLPPPTAGRVEFNGVSLTGLHGSPLRRMRRDLQLVFQDPVSSLNPRRTVFDVVREPLVVAGVAGDHRTKVHAMLDAVGIDPGLGDRRPHQFSGGQCQRICIARALVTGPSLLICDEPVSALDVSIQAQVLNLLEELKVTHGLTMVFISHDLSVVKSISDRVAVMYLGKLCEIGPGPALYQAAAHPYSRALLAAVPAIDRRRVDADPPLRGELPSAIDPPSGCRFRTRCERATSRCAVEEPRFRAVGVDHFVACHHPVVQRLVADGPA